MHTLNLDKNMPAKSQKRRLWGTVQAEALEEEVARLLKCRFIWEAKYPIQVANPVLVPKPNGKWRTYIDFFDLNKACPKGCFPLPRIDQLVDATAGHKLMSFMDAYFGYNQIAMNPAEQDHTSIMTGHKEYWCNISKVGL